MADCEKCLFVSVCKKRPKMPGAKIAECNTFRERLNKEKHMTNADRIRAMSDEELARHLHCIGWDCNLCAEHKRLDNEPLLRGDRCDENCFEHCLEWLKQPVEE